MMMHNDTAIFTPTTGTPWLNVVLVSKQIGTEGIIVKAYTTLLEGTMFTKRHSTQTVVPVSIDVFQAIM